MEMQLGSTLLLKPHSISILLQGLAPLAVCTLDHSVLLDNITQHLVIPSSQYNNFMNSTSNPVVSSGTTMNTLVSDVKHPQANNVPGVLCGQNQSTSEKVAENITDEIALKMSNLLSESNMLKGAFSRKSGNEPNTDYSNPAIQLTSEAVNSAIHMSSDSDSNHSIDVSMSTGNIMNGQGNMTLPDNFELPDETVT